MAERRMFAKQIIDSDAFLDMPLSTQCLYFHLSMRADDEGFINNPKKIQRMIGASDDDLKVLISKNFIIPFESGIVVIKHWRIHNYIRGDRLQYTEEKGFLEIKENGAYTLCQSNDSQMTVKCQSSDSQMSDTLDTEVRLGKDSIDKDSKDIISSKNTIDYQIIVDIYHYRCPSLPKVSKITDARKKLINARLKDYSVKELEQAFKLAEASDFLTGRNGKWGGANFDWIMNTNNIVKILEGNYKNKQSETPKNGFTNFENSESAYDWDDINRELGLK